MIGARRSSLVQTGGPIASTVIAWAALGEHLAWTALLGIVCIVAGIVFALVNEPPQTAEGGGEPGIFSVRGCCYALVGTLFHGCGGVLARQAWLSSPGLDPVVATAVRVTVSALALAATAPFWPAARRAFGKLRVGGATLPLVAGTVTGPVTGMVFYLAAFRYAPAGIAVTLSSLSPVLILPLVVVLYKTRVRREAVIGAFIAVSGVALIAFAG